MKTTDRIIDEYLQGDFENRLNLYLQYPLLREAFTEIDLAESPESEMNSTFSVRKNRFPCIVPQLKRYWHVCRVAFARL